jgi:hypothetical protein
MSIFKMLSDKVKTYEAFQNQNDTAANAQENTEQTGNTTEEETSTETAPKAGTITTTKVIGSNTVPLLQSPSPAKQESKRQDALTKAIGLQTSMAQGDAIESAVGK